MRSIEHPLISRRYVTIMLLHMVEIDYQVAAYVQDLPEKDMLKSGDMHGMVR